MKARYTFQEILDGTLAVIRDLPVNPPAEGVLAGFLPFVTENVRKLSCYDNIHYAAGTTYYRLGVAGVARQARANAETKTGTQRTLLLAIAETYDELSRYFTRYADAVRTQASGEERLLRTADNLQALSQNPPATFEQAAQLMFLMWCVRSPAATSCIGRLDVHLRSFYEADIAAGRTTREEAYTVILELWRKLNSWGSGDTLMQLMVGGCQPDGTDDSSDLSVMMLDATRELGMTEPHINVRYHKNIRPDVMEAARRLQYLGGGQASIYNDEVLIPEMLRCGIPKEIAYRYANDGCTEIIWDGCGRIDFNHIDTVATLELALYNGAYAPGQRDEVRYFHSTNKPGLYQPDAEVGFKSGKVEECETYEEMYELFMKQYLYQIDDRLNKLWTMDRELKEGVLWGLPLLNGTYEQVLESGRDMLADGLPMNSYMVFLGSIPTVADSLAALKTVVYRDRHYTLEQVKEAMEANFEGYEVMRAELLNAPKFGNDLDEVDDIATGIVIRCLDHIEAFRKEKSFDVFGALLGWQFVQESYATGAMPDGRRSKDPIAEHYCATPGKATNGVTALINSIAKAPLARALGVAPTHISLPRSAMPTEEEGLTVLKAISEACIAKGFMEFNIAIYDTDLLRKAQQDPERYADVIVRVWGFSAKFVELAREMQDHIIARALGGQA